MQLEYIKNSKLPRLSWIAKVNKDTGFINVEHGVAVECHKSWMVEGVWDGSFAKGQFHESYNFFGSGIRTENDRVYFVSSNALVDRLIFCEFLNQIYVSNSLILLLAATNAKLDPAHDYLRESISILKGINNYDKKFKIIHTEIKYFNQLFSENLIVSKDGTEFKKRIKSENISTYDEYLEKLNMILDLIGKNYRDPKRNIKMDAYTTISRGYDSTAVSSLVKDLGVKTAFTIKTRLNPIRSKLKKLLKRGLGTVSDDGTITGESLGYKMEYLDSQSTAISKDELYFLSTPYPKFATTNYKPFILDGKEFPVIDAWSELSHHTMAKFIERNSSAAILFTGYHGDKVWERKLPSRYLKNDILRGDVSGLNLTEIRLKSGFVNVAVPFILAKNIKSINNISNSDEMKSWSLNRENYDRPIPRRIAESLGIDRNQFGMNKNWVNFTYYIPIDKKIKMEFLNYLRRVHGISKIKIYSYIGIKRLINILLFVFFHFKLTTRFHYTIDSIEKYDFYYLMNHWAIELLSKEVREHLNNRLLLTK